LGKRLGAVGVFLALLVSMAWGAAWAEELPVYATAEECYDAHEVPCQRTDKGWSPTETGDPGTITHHEHEYDQENLARQRISMPTNTSGTLEQPVVAVDMNQVIFPDVQPYLDLEVGRVRVPVRFVSEQMGATVEWDFPTQTVTILREGLSIQLTVDDPVVIVNGARKTIDAPPRLVNPGRVMVPLRFITEAFGATVDWVGDQTPDHRALSWGQYQVWIWTDWGYWGNYGLQERLQVQNTWFYRGPGK
jgi:hypothetical protein